MWRDLKRIVFWALMIAVFAIVGFTLMGDHEADYGSLTLPPGGNVELPEGKVKIFYDEGGQSIPGSSLSAPLTFQVVPAGGGEPLTSEATRATESGAVNNRRSEDVISRGSVAELEVPEEGTYAVTGGTAGASPGVIKFGTDPFTAVVRKWRLLGGLLAAALLVTFLPVPRHRRSGDAAWPAEA